MFPVKHPSAREGEAVEEDSLMGVSTATAMSLHDASYLPRAREGWLVLALLAFPSFKTLKISAHEHFFSLHPLS